MASNYKLLYVPTTCEYESLGPDADIFINNWVHNKWGAQSLSQRSLEELHQAINNESTSSNAQYYDRKVLLYHCFSNIISTEHLIGGLAYYTYFQNGGNPFIPTTMYLQDMIAQINKVDQAPNLENLKDLYLDLMLQRDNQHWLKKDKPSTAIVLLGDSKDSKDAVEEKEKYLGHIYAWPSIIPTEEKWAHAIGIRTSIVNFFTHEHREVGKQLLQGVIEWCSSSSNSFTHLEIQEPLPVMSHITKKYFPVQESDGGLLIDLVKYNS